MSGSYTSIAAIGLALAALTTGPLGLAVAQPSAVQLGEVVPRDVREIYDRGLQFLAASQSEDGTWDGGEPGPNMKEGLGNAAQADGSWASAGKQGAGVTALALLAFLASGEDANFGIYSGHIRKALRSVIRNQNAKTGYIGPSMYHHGFAMLALAEAYGAVDESSLWPDNKAPRSIGQALELAVRTAITSQKKNPNGAWRYSPDARDADASVSGAVIIGLLAARNAGIEVPDQSIDKAIAYLRSMTDRSGDVFYQNLGNRLSSSTARVSIAALAYAVARRKGTRGIQGDSRLPQAADRRARGTFRGIHPLLRGPGPLPGEPRLLGKVEQDPHPPAQGGSAARRQHPGPVQPADLHVAVAALAGVELSLPSHLRTVRASTTIKPVMSPGQFATQCVTNRVGHEERPHVAEVGRVVALPNSAWRRLASPSRTRLP